MIPKVERCDERIPNDATSSFDHGCPNRWRYEVMESSGDARRVCGTHYRMLVRANRLAQIKGIEEKQAMAKQTVAILWRGTPTDDGIRTLIYRPEGTVRTYDRAALDPRVGEVVDVTTIDQFLEIASKADNTKMAVPVSLAKRIMPGSKFAVPAGRSAR